MTVAESELVNESGMRVVSALTRESFIGLVPVAVFTHARAEKTNPIREKRRDIKNNFLIDNLFG